MSNRYRTILFDLDATLIDNEAALRSIFPDISRKYPILSGYEERIFPLYFDFPNGENAYWTLCQELNWENPPPYTVFWEYFWFLYVHATVCFPCVVPTLRALRKKGYTLGIITNGDTYGQNAKIDSGNLRQYFDVVLVSNTLGIHKPDPRIYEIAMGQLGAEKHTTLFVGDNPKTDILGAQNAGIDSFLITNGNETFGATYAGLDVSSLLKIL